MATKAHLDGNKRYLEKLDRVVFYTKKGQKDIISDYAIKAGNKSLNAYINKLIEEDMKKAGNPLD